MLVAAKVGAEGSIISYIGFAWDKQGMMRFDADTFHFRRQQLRSSMARPGTRAAEALELLASGLLTRLKCCQAASPYQTLPKPWCSNRDDKANAIKMVMVNSACTWPA